MNYHARPIARRARRSSRRFRRDAARTVVTRASGL
jgi:hypothetical protein